MKLIKSLFLGSAAGLVAISGASAADLAVTKPAPAEYVKVCSVGGMTGFTIPGSDICLDIGGRVRVDVQFGDNVDLVTGVRGAGTDFGYNINSTARLSFDARTDTSLGVLRSNIVLDFPGGTIDRAFIQLGGFVVGRAGSVMGIDDFDLVGVPFDDGVDQISYTFATDSGFYVSLGIEDRFAGTLDNFSDEFQGVAAIGYSGGGTEVRLGGYANTLDQFGVTLQATTTLGSGTTILGIAQYEDFDGSERWAAGLKISQAFSDVFMGYLQGSYAELDAAVDTTSFAITGGFEYTVVPGFVVGPEVTYSNVEVGAVETDSVTGRLRFQRNF